MLKTVKIQKERANNKRVTKTLYEYVNMSYFESIKR